MHGLLRGIESLVVTRSRGSYTGEPCLHGGQHGACHMCRCAWCVVCDTHLGQRFVRKCTDTLHQACPGAVLLYGLYGCINTAACYIGNKWCVVSSAGRQWCLGNKPQQLRCQQDAHGRLTKQAAARYGGRGTMGAQLRLPRECGEHAAPRTVQVLCG